jgi:hypothetical protein
MEADKIGSAYSEDIDESTLFLAGRVPGMESLQDDGKLSLHRARDRRDILLQSLQPGGDLCVTALEKVANIERSWSSSSSSLSATDISKSTFEEISAMGVRLRSLAKVHQTLVGDLRRLVDILESMLRSLAGQLSRARECEGKVHRVSERLRMTRLFFLLHKWRRTVQVYKPELRRQRELHKFRKVLSIAGMSRSKRQSSVRGQRSLSNILQHRSTAEGMAYERKRQAHLRVRARAERFRNEAPTTTVAPNWRVRHPYKRSLLDAWEGENWSPLDIVTLSIDA